MSWKPYMRLMRFHKPSGIFLLWFPIAWTLWIVNHGRPSTELITYFLLGTVVMRSAGCVVNDLADRRIDQHVARTSMRPLATGELGLLNAIGLFVGLISIAFFIVLQLPILCFYYALVALFITILYPFCKRFFKAPQLILGLAYSMGIPMACSASGVAMNQPIGWLLLLNFAWIVSYDTMYAMTDKEDDLRIGVKSTAILFGSYDRLIILGLQLFFHSLWLIIAVEQHHTAYFYAYWAAGALVLAYQQYLLGKNVATAYYSAFFSNLWYGALLWFGLVIGNT